jgi:hypothetical protein
MKKETMVVTKKYENFGTLSTRFYGRAILNNLYKNIGKVVEREGSTNNSSSFLTTNNILSSISVRGEFTTYNDLYGKYLTKIDVGELATMISQFTEGFEKETGYQGLNLLKSYFFACLMNDWTERVEHAFQEFEKRDITLSYVGSDEEPDYKIYKIIRDIAYPKTSINHIYSFADKILTIISHFLEEIKKRRELELSRFLKGFTDKPVRLKIDESKQVIVIGILEARRFGRIAELHREFISKGYEVVVFSALHKRETLAEIKQYPELASSLILDSYFVRKAEAQEILVKSKEELKRLCILFKKSGKLSNYKYKGVPLIDIAWDDIQNVILLRGMQHAINAKCIDEFMQDNKVAAFVGMDNSVATSVWINKCEMQGIPTFFHYYNAALSPIIYRLLLESFNPTGWILGGKRQMGYFREVEPSKNYYLSGDMFADTIVRCDREEIRKTLKDRVGITDESKVIVLVSSYIVADFTIERKKMLFQSVAISAAELGMSLIVKAHPNENLETLTSEMKLWNIQAPIFQTENIRDVFIAADVVCMYFSEAAQQAMLIGTPVISLIPNEMVDDFDKHWDYFSSKAIEHVSLGSSPRIVIEKIMNDEAYRKGLVEMAYSYTENLLGKLDGNNARRFADIVDSAINN